MSDSHCLNSSNGFLVFSKIRKLFIPLLFLPLLGISQKGPGGVSVETATQSTCRMWLDASTLTTLADGDDVTSWPDVSLSAELDEAVAAPGELPAYFRDDPANTINGYPVLTFEDGRFLVVNESSDLNLQGETFEKTVFLAFRTSTDVTSKQVLYEEGGCWRGLNIYIDGGQVYCGAYDLNSGGINNNGSTDPGGTPQWGYSFVSRPIQANSTYILTMQFYAEDDGQISTNSTGNNYYIRGWLNGQVFNVMDFNTRNLTNTNGSNTGINGIGSLSAHPDPIGLGAVNSDYVDHDGLDCNNTGANSFKGRLAELCYYNEALSESKRIIIENYLGAKYFANIITNDKYDFQGTYGNDVIGIGQQLANPTNNPSFYHDNSQGRNPFRIRASNTSLAFNNTANRFFLTGHNGQSLLYTNSGVPQNSQSIQRLQRIWRIDERSNFPEVQINVNSDDLPPRPAGFNRLVLLIDETSANFPNFSLSSTVVREIPNVGGNNYQVNYNFADNSFFTLAWLRPTVQFSLNESFGIESDPSPDSTLFNLQIELNFTPAPITGNNFSVDLTYVDGSALSTTDYGYDYLLVQNGVDFPLGSQFQTIPIYIKNDTDPENPSTESLSIVLYSGSNTTSGLVIGARDTLTFSIYDNDPPPKASFDASNSSVAEDGLAVQLTVLRSGDNSGTSTVEIRQEPPPGQGTATYGADYTCESAEGWFDVSPDVRGITLTFAPGENTQTALVTIFEDEIDEYDQTMNFTLIPVSNIGIDTLNPVIEHTVSLIDNDPEPVANFLANNQTGYESVGDPVIFVELDRPSEKDVEVSYQISEGTAANEEDYTSAENGTLLIPPGDTLAFPTNLFVLNEEPTDEPDETFIVTLTSGVNSTIGSVNQHTYTIVDYAPFEWRGAAGVGKASDNIVWIDADRMSGAGPKQSITNFSPRDINIVRQRNNSNQEASLLIDALNDRNALNFDGSTNTNNADCYTIDNSSFTNLAGFVEKKSFFFVIRPDLVPSVSVGNTVDPNSDQCAMIYEQGAGTRGISIYLYNGRLYFHAWNDNNDGPESPWGYDQGQSSNANRIASSTYARSSQTLSAGSSYVISCHFDNSSSEPLMVYVNGTKGVMSSNITSANDVGRLYAHAGRIGLGAVDNGTRFHFSTSQGTDRGAAYNGLLAEFIKFHEPQMNEARRIIIENYLSAKYDIPLSGTGSLQVFDLTYASGSDKYNEGVAGVGQKSAGVLHGDAQGPSSVLRIQNPQFASASTEGYLLWGHNGESLVNTWPFSYGNGSLPSGITERSGQVWKVFESPTNTVNSATLLINFSASGNALELSQDPSLLKLLVSSNENDFSGATVYDVTDMRSGYVAEFANVPITDGMYFTLGNTSPITQFPLPVELLYFRAQFIRDFVELKWATATEINNDKFVIERAGENLEWKDILTVEGSGNSNSRINYSEKDLDPLTGISYYRLRQVDYDGSFVHSEIVSVFNAKIQDEDQVFIYPNPSKGLLFLRIPYAFRSHPAHLRLYSISGNLILSQQLNSEVDIHELLLGGIPAGIYMVHIYSDLFSETKKLVVE